MRTFRVAVIGVLTCVVAWSTSPGLVAATRVNTPSATCGPTWGIVPSPSPGNDFNGLNAVSSISSVDAWAVGASTTITGDITFTTVPLILHWDGATWMQFPSNSSPGSHSLLDVVETSSSDAWAVGPTYSGPGPYVEHWDGTAWSEVSVPSIGITASLNGITAVSSADVWAVGSYVDDVLGSQTLVEHWDGTSWTIVSSPNLGTDANSLIDATAISANDVWATGNVSNSQLQKGKPYFAHWDGTSWSLVRAWWPKVATESGVSGVDANSSGAVFAAGQVEFPQTGIFAENWSGSRWSPLSVVTPQAFPTLVGVAVNDGGEAWVVGLSHKSGGANKTLIEHSTGGSFVLDISPNVPGATNELIGADASPGGDVWAVGDSTVNGFPAQTLIEHLCP